MVAFYRELNQLQPSGAFPPGDRPGRPVRPAELVLYSILALALAGLGLVRGGGPHAHALTYDSYQFLSVAENLRSHRSAATSIVHFDVERARGAVPAPSTTFPSGYPAAIALLSFTGLSPEWLGVLLSAAATVAVLLLIHLAAPRLRLPPLAERVALAGWVLGAQASFYASTIHSEALFTALALAGIVLLLPAPAGLRDRPVAGSIAIGLATWVRYAGLFLVVPLHLYGLYRLARDPSRRRSWVAGLVACDALVAVLLARNWLIAGTWRGGNVRSTLQPVGRTAKYLVAASGHLAFGSLERRPLFLLLVGLALAGGLGLAVAWVRAVRTSPAPDDRRQGTRVLLLFTVSYVAAMAYTWTTTDVSPGPRMLLPILPVLLLLVAAAVARVEGAADPGPGALRGWAGVSLAALVAGYGGANLWAMAHETRRAPHVAVSAALALPMADGRSVSAWIAENVPPGAVLMATEGQPTGYLLGRRTVSFVSREYSDATWEDEVTRRVARQFGVGFVLVYRDGPDGPTDPVVKESALLAGLAAGRSPGWLELAAESPGVLVYRIRPPG